MLCMQSIVLKLFNLIEIFVDNIDKEYCLIISAKCYSSNLNNVCTISQLTLSAGPQKSYGQLQSV